MTNDHKVLLSFHGGVGSVTGANFLLQGERTKILIDCGLIQGEKFAHALNRESFAYDPASVDFLLVTHAHIDHIGRIPKLVRDGFHGKIISTPQTLDLSRLMLPDAFSVLRSEMSEGEELLYEEKDITAAFSLWETKPYHQPFLAGEFEIVFKDSGHILGSAMVEVQRKRAPFLEEKGRPFSARKLVFTGDLGNYPTPLLKAAESVEGTTYLVMESVYGDRNHEGGERRKERLARTLNCCVWPRRMPFGLAHGKQRFSGT